MSEERHVYQSFIHCPVPILFFFFIINILIPSIVDLEYSNKYLIPNKTGRKILICFMLNNVENHSLDNATVIITKNDYSAAS